MNLKKEVELLNRPLAKMHGLDARTSKKLKGKVCTSCIELEICKTNCIVEACIETNAPIRFDEVKGKNKQGDELTLIVSAIPIRDSGGHIISVMEIHRNVSDEAKINAKYHLLLDKEKKAKEAAEDLVRVRTQELREAEAQLVHSEKMSSLGQMVAGLAHEMNNPINFITGNVDIMKEYVVDLDAALSQLKSLGEGSTEYKEKSEKIYKDLDVDFKIDDLADIAKSIQTGSERAAEIIQGLRTFSRLDEAELKETDVHGDIDTTLMLLKGQIKEGGVEILKEYGDFTSFPCFSSQLNQVYMNLLQNAIQAVGEDGKIWIKTELHETKGLHIEIRDNGSGIPEDKMGKIFDPFFTTKPVGEGTGLGLAVSYGIVERHKGKIAVESKVGQGTLFSVEIPYPVLQDN